MTDRTTIADDRFALAFYGAEPATEAVERFFRLVVRWFGDLGFPPNRLGVTGPGYGKKMGDYRRGLKRVEGLGFSEVSFFEVKALKPDDASGALHYASAVFSRGERSGRYAIVSVPSQRALKSVWLPVAQETVECLRPEYGVAFERPLMKGPVFYAMGINCGGIRDAVAVGDEYDRRRSISFWMDAMRKEVYREGLLRYVYRWNFLTQPQLERHVEGMPLARWIKADAKRGTLSLLCEDMWLWEVQEEQLETLRDRLHDAGAIFDWRRYFNIEPHIKTVLG